MKRETTQSRLRVNRLDLIAPAATVALAVVHSLLEVYAPAVPHPSILLIVAIAFGAFYRGTAAGLTCALIVALSFIGSYFWSSVWRWSSEGEMQVLILTASVPIAFLGGITHDRVLAISSRLLKREQEHAHELTGALGRVVAADRELNLANEALEERVEQRTEELTHALDDLTAGKADLKKVSADARQTFEALDQHVAVAINDSQNRFTHVNAKFVALTGFSKSEIVGRTPEVLYHCQDGPALFAQITDQVVRGEPWSGELKLTSKSGREFWAEPTVVPCFDEEGQFERTLTMFTDISQRKLAQEALQDSEERYRRLADSAFEGLMFHENGVILDANQAMADLVWLSSADELIGKHVLDVFPLSDESRAIVRGQLVAKSSDPFELTLAGPSLQSRTIEIQGQNCVYRGREARVVAFHDVTMRLRAESGLRLLSRAVEQSPATVMITDPNGAIQYVNPKFEELTGYAREEVIGKNPRILKSGRTPLEVYEELWRRIAAGQEWRGELCNRNKSGELFWEFASITGLTDESGQVINLVAVKVDITERKRIEQQLVESRFEIIQRLALATEYRDDDTGAHVRRIGMYAQILGEAAGLSSAEVESLMWASTLHDVGKLAIPDAILLKPGKLTPNEFEVMKTHAAIGAVMLAGSEHPLLRTAERIALTHHERWDGSGYPRGLKGDAIPIEGRICAICDAFDAMTSVRPYKGAWTFEEAMAEIERCKGSHFDPELADKFLSLQGEIRKVQLELGKVRQPLVLAEAA